MSFIEIAQQKYLEVSDLYNKTGYREKYKFDEIWGQHNFTDLQRIIFGTNDDIELIHNIEQTNMYSINFAPEDFNKAGVRELAIDWLLKAQRKVGLEINDLPANLEESEFIHPANKKYHDSVPNRMLTPNFLRSVSEANQIKKYARSTNRVLELGAGCGYTARVISLWLKPEKYFIIDLPETLCFSFVHLSLCFPDKKLLYVSSEEDLAVVEDYDIVFVPTFFAESLPNKQFDVFLNTASMGEMLNDNIRYWINYIQNVADVDFIYVLNRFLNTIIHGDPSFNWRLADNEASVLYDEKWDIKNWEVEPLYCRCPYVDTFHARYLEISALRDTSLKLEPEISQALLDSVKLEDWYRYNDYPRVTMHQHNTLITNSDMDSTIYKLWNSIRLNKNKDNIETMLKYLRTLVHDKVHNVAFEEEEYYSRLLGTV